MYKNLDQIKNALFDCGIKKDDLIFIHADEILGAQISSSETEEDPVLKFIQALIDLIGDQGTIVVPTFTYSFTTSKQYDIENSISEVGKFSEKFRNIKKAIRSRNPIFSVASIGKLSKKIKKLSEITSFGSQSIFDFLYKNNGKIFCIGCSFNRVTFTHFVEEKLKIKYRYHKKFDGRIIDDKRTSEVMIDYYVRDLAFDTVCNLSNLKKLMVENNKLKIGSFGRVLTYMCDTQSFFKSCEDLLSKNEFGLINFGHNEISSYRHICQNSRRR